jgi:hypothetical protein
MYICFQYVDFLNTLKPAVLQGFVNFYERSFLQIYTGTL